MESLQVYAGDGRAPVDLNKYDDHGRQHGWWYTGGQLKKTLSDTHNVESAMIKFNHGDVDGPAWVSLYPLKRDAYQSRQYFGCGMIAKWDPKNNPLTSPELHGWWVFHDILGVSQGFLDRNRRRGIWYELPDDGKPYTQRYALNGAPLSSNSTPKGDKAGWTQSSRPTHLESIEDAWREIGIPQEKWYDFSVLDNPYFRFEGL